jgi:hypothetical protein
MKSSLGNLLPGKLDHGRGDVHTDHPITAIGEFFRPNPASTAEVHDQPLGDAVLSEPLQEARCRSSGKLAKALVVNVGEIALIRARVGHV